MTRFSKVLLTALSLLTAAACSVDDTEEAGIRSAEALELEVLDAVHSGDITPVANFDNGMESVPYEGVTPTELVTMCGDELPVGAVVDYDCNSCTCGADGALHCTVQACTPAGQDLWGSQPDGIVDPADPTQVAAEVTVLELEHELGTQIEQGEIVPEGCTFGSESDLAGPEAMPTLLPTEAELMCGEGMPIGSEFKFACNTCECQPNGELWCTKAFCQETVLSQ